MVKAKKKKRGRYIPRLARLRKTVSVTHRIYGLLVQAHEDLRYRVLGLEQRLLIDEKGESRRLEEEQEALLGLLDASRNFV